MSEDFFKTTNSPNVIEFRNSAGAESTTNIKTKIIEIGDWNMDITNTISPLHGLSDHTKIRHVSAMIREDSPSTNQYPFLLGKGSTTITSPHGSFGPNTNTVIQMFRTSGGDFDNSAFEDTSYNRGWILIIYEE